MSVKTDAAPNTGGSGGGSGTSVLKIKPANPPAGTAGATYTHTFAASGGTKPYTFAVTGGSLPDSLALEENGRLTGTPAAEGTYEITVTVEDHAGRISTHAYTLIITEGEATEPSDIVPDAPLSINIVLTVGKPEALVDGEPVRLDAAPYIEAPVGRTFVPVRFIGEALGATVEWLAASKQVVIRDGGTEIILTIGSKTVLVNGEAQAIDCSPVVLPPGRTFVPLRFVSETLGASVDYDGAAKQITICR
ncbi:MAG: stalk domain-containing protein [bacterium]